MLEAVIKAITPKIMTWSQYAEAAWFMYQKKVMKNPAYKRYMPDYTKCVDHFALHAGKHSTRRELGRCCMYNIAVWAGQHMAVKAKRDCAVEKPLLT